MQRSSVSDSHSMARLLNINAPLTSHRKVPRISKTSVGLRGFRPAQVDDRHGLPLLWEEFRHGNARRASGAPSDRRRPSRLPNVLGSPIPILEGGQCVRERSPSRRSVPEKSGPGSIRQRSRQRRSVVDGRRWRQVTRRRGCGRPWNKIGPGLRRRTRILTCARRRYLTVRNISRNIRYCGFRRPKVCGPRPR